VSLGPVRRNRRTHCNICRQDCSAWPERYAL